MWPACEPHVLKKKKKTLSVWLCTYLGRQVMKKKHNELKAAIEKGIIDDTKAVGKLWECSVSWSCLTCFLHGFDPQKIGNTHACTVCASVMLWAVLSVTYIHEQAKQKKHCTNPYKMKVLNRALFSIARIVCYISPGKYSTEIFLHILTIKQ